MRRTASQSCWEDSIVYLHGLHGLCWQKDSLPATTETFPFSCQQDSFAQQQETQKGKPTFNRASLENSWGTPLNVLCPVLCTLTLTSDVQCIPTEKTPTAQSPFYKINSSSKSEWSPYPTAVDLWMLGNYPIIGSGSDGARCAALCTAEPELPERSGRTMKPWSGTSA